MKKHRIIELVNTYTVQELLIVNVLANMIRGELRVGRRRPENRKLVLLNYFCFNERQQWVSAPNADNAPKNTVR